MRQCARSFFPSYTPRTVLVLPTSIARSITRTLTRRDPERTSSATARHPRPQPLHVPGQHPLDRAVLRPHEQRTRGVNVLGQSPEFLAVRADQHILAQRGGQLLPALPDGG